MTGHSLTNKRLSFAESRETSRRQPDTLDTYRRVVQRERKQEGERDRGRVVSGEFFFHRVESLLPHPFPSCNTNQFRRVLRLHAPWTRWNFFTTLSAPFVHARASLPRATPWRNVRSIMANVTHRTHVFPRQACLTDTVLVLFSEMWYQSGLSKQKRYHTFATRRKISFYW